MIKRYYLKRILLFFIIQFILICIVQKNYSNAMNNIKYSSETAIIPAFSSYEEFVKKFLDAAKNVYNEAHGHWRYGDSNSIPPCDDGIISCDRLICRALWEMGFTDQAEGGFSINGGKDGEYLTTHGFEFVEGNYDIKPGDIIRINSGRAGDTGHVFLITEYDSNTQICKKYDMGSDAKINSNQPFRTKLMEQVWINMGRTYDGYYRWKGGSSSSSTEAIQNLKSIIDINEGKPEKYDIYIDGDDLDPDNGLEIPAIQTSLDYIIFKNDGLSNIDFFDTNTFSNKASLKNVSKALKQTLKDNWNDLSKKVKSTYKVLLYIALGFMGTALIVIGLLIVKGAVFKDTITSLMKKNMGVTDDKLPNEYYQKKFTNQWIFTLLTLILIIIVIILTISSTGAISKLTSTYNEKDKLLDSVKVYAKAVVNSSSSSSNGLGTKKDIDANTVDKNGNNLVNRMKPSLHGNSIDSLVDSNGSSRLYLSYLTIPYYDLNGQVQTGEMVVHKQLADEVLLIFQELYNIKYPIERMELVDKYTNATNGKEADDWTSIQANNTSAFNYRNANDGQHDLENLSNHAYGKCIDINPLVNPYIINYYSHTERPYTTHRPEDGPNGTNSNPNYDDKFIKRVEMTGWTEVEKREKIAKDTEIYNIFMKYGWNWLEYAGSNGIDAQHLEKLDVSNVKTIDWNSINNKSSKSSSTTTSGSESDIIFIGDSRTYYFTEDVNSSATLIYKTGEGYSWMKNTAFSEADSKVKSGSKIILWLGVNDLANIDNYIREVNNKAQEWVGKGATVYYAAVGPLDYDPSRNATNEGIEEFNNKLKNGLSSDVQYIDLYTKLKNEGYSTRDGIHYTKETTQKIYDFLVNEVTSGNSSSGNSSSSRNPSGPSPFTKYQLTDEQLTGLAAVGYSEQGSLEGIAAEASLMANLFELHHNGVCHGLTGGDGLYKMVGAPVSDETYFWFEGASTYIDTGHTYEGEPVQEEWKAVVKSVLVDGKRTLPGYIDEHVAAGTATYITTNGVNYYSFSEKTDRNNFIPHQTIVHQPNGNGDYIYYCHVADSTDPFGYTSEEARARIGEFHYNFDGTAVGSSGSTMDIGFTTNFEGLYMILSNYNWENFLGHNIIYLICGMILSALKISLHIIFYARMLIIGGIIAIIPVIIVINAFMKIKGNKGIFKKWAILYLECLFYRPLIQIIYRIFADNKNKSVEENPFYIMFVAIIIIIITIIYIKKIYRDFRKKEIVSGEDED